MENIIEMSHITYASYHWSEEPENASFGTFTCETIACLIIEYPLVLTPDKVTSMLAWR